MDRGREEGGERGGYQRKGNKIIEITARGKGRRKRKEREEEGHEKQGGKSDQSR